MLRTIAMCVCAALVFAAAASGARVDLLDGRSFTGEIVEETEKVVALRTVIAGIETTLELPRSLIAKIDRAAIWERENEAAREERARGERNDGAGGGLTSYLEVPIVGEIGVDVTANGVEHAIAFARRGGIQHIVFAIDTAGGYVEEAVKIAGVIDRYDDELQTHAVLL
ncbi:MAG: hypothetical protein VYC34_02500, partial [Planctomycetota bacterium]|nr:hypothetical protein [Planctomycetota bacterium]